MLFAHLGNWSLYYRVGSALAPHVSAKEIPDPTSEPLPVTHASGRVSWENPFVSFSSLASKRARLLAAAVLSVFLVAAGAAALATAWGLGASPACVAPTSTRTASVSSAARTTGARAANAQSALPTGLPAHFGFGLMSDPGSTGAMNAMRSANGAAWDYRYTYLSAGVNTGNGWATWNTPAGQYATYYMQDSASNGYLPTFVYYMLLQSNGPGGANEQATDLAHLTNPATMRAYYADWTLLMQKIGAFGKTTMVIVEPDLWGYIEQATGASHTAETIPASVASSGDLGAQAFPNTAQGFAWTLLHARDRYAPNALLALHASPWGTRTDVASTPSAINAAGIGAQEASFLRTAGLSGAPSGVSTFDLVSADIADHDAGQSGLWWDPHNVTAPNFARYLTYAHALAGATGKSLLLWQIPLGNQYFDTENNSQGHTQDNKAQYILEHVPDFEQAGIIGVLFGPGNGGTQAFDMRKDGVTNPAPIATYQCDHCNSHTSVYADDDGGFLRIFVGHYYLRGAYVFGSSSYIAPTPIGQAPAPSATATTGAPISVADATQTVAPTTGKAPRKCGV